MPLFSDWDSSSLSATLQGLSLIAVIVTSVFAGAWTFGLAIERDMALYVRLQILEHEKAFHPSEQGLTCPEH